jgi:hypothetical protein
MASGMQYNSVDNAVGKLAKMQEFFDLGYSTALEIALDIEESNATGESSPEVEQLKKVTLEYVQMEKELKQWQQAAEMTKTAFTEEYKNAKEYVLLKLWFWNIHDAPAPLPVQDPHATSQN